MMSICASGISFGLASLLIPAFDNPTCAPNVIHNIPRRANERGAKCAFVESATTTRHGVNQQAVMADRDSIQALSTAEVSRSAAEIQLAFQLHGPTVVLVNFEGESLARVDSLLERCRCRIDHPHFNVIDMGTSAASSVGLYGVAPILALLKLPHPLLDPKGFSRTLDVFEQLAGRRHMRIVPVMREGEQQPGFLRQIVSTCPFYMSLLSDQEDQRRLLTSLIESIL